jgi:hypothetical protein
MNIHPIRLCDLAEGERYVYGDFGQPYRLSDALTLPGAERRGSSFYFPQAVVSTPILRKVLTKAEQFAGKMRTPVDQAFEESDWR